MWRIHSIKGKSISEKDKPLEVNSITGYPYSYFAQGYSDNSP